MTGPAPAKKAPAKRATRARRAEAEKPAAPPEPPTPTEVTAAPDTGQEWNTTWDVPEAMTVEQWEKMNPRSVHELWGRVMESVKSVEKGDYNKDQHFRFRGIDAVMEAVGPALREHHVHVRPRRILEHFATEYTSKNGGRMVNRIVRVEWEVTGPQGDSFVGESMGEAADSSDKAMTKAQSVAYRVFLLNALTIPTGDPDPDAETAERATPSEREQALAQASEKTYTSREEFEQSRQAQAGEENQAAQQDNEAARKELWRVAKGLGWQWNALASRFKADHGMDTKQADAKTIEAFTAAILKEAEAEEDKAKQLVQNELGGKEVGPEEPPAEEAQSLL